LSRDSPDGAAGDATTLGNRAPCPCKTDQVGFTAGQDVWDVNGNEGLVQLRNVLRGRFCNVPSNEELVDTSPSEGNETDDENNNDEGELRNLSDSSEEPEIEIVVPVSVDNLSNELENLDTTPNDQDGRRVKRVGGSTVMRSPSASDDDSFTIPDDPESLENNNRTGQFRIPLYERNEFDDPSAASTATSLSPYRINQQALLSMISSPPPFLSELTPLKNQAAMPASQSTRMYSVPAKSNSRRYESDIYYISILLFTFTVYSEHYTGVWTLMI